MNSQLLPKSSQYVRLGVALNDQMKPECVMTDSPIGTICNPGFELEIFALVAKILNLELEIKYANIPGCGYLMKNGSWNGLLGMLQRDEIDIIGNICRFDDSRTKEGWLQKSWPVSQNRQYFLIKAPQLKYSFSIGGPFDYLTWLTLLITIIVFALIFACFYKFMNNTSYMASIKNGMIDVCSFIIGVERQRRYLKYRHIWFMFACLFGYMCVVYNTFITTAILRPIAVQKPFKNNMDLVKALHKGQYKIVDFYIYPKIRCFNTGTCHSFQNAIEEHGFHFIDATGSKASNLVLNDLLVNRNLVFVNSEDILRTLLHGFHFRDQLWLIKDEMAGEEFWGFFFRKNFSHKYLFDETLKKMGSATDNVRYIYTSLSYRTRDTETIKGEMPKQMVIEFSLVNNLLIYCGIGVVLALFILLLEIFAKFNRKLESRVVQTDML